MTLSGEPLELHRHIETKRSSGFEVDQPSSKFRWGLDGKLARLLGAKRMHPHGSPLAEKLSASATPQDSRRLTSAKDKQRHFADGGDKS